MITQKEHIKEAIEHIKDAVDRFPDKDDIIRLDNDILYGIVASLKVMIGDKNYD